MMICPKANECVMDEEECDHLLPHNIHSTCYQTTNEFFMDEYQSQICPDCINIASNEFLTSKEMEL